MKNEYLVTKMSSLAKGLCLVLALTSCGGENDVQVNPGRVTSISGNVDVENIDSVSVFQYEVASLGQRKHIVSSALNATGQFDISWTASDASRYEIALDERTVWWGMYIEPGDDIELGISRNGSELEIEFGGDNKEFQQYLWHSQRAFGGDTELNMERAEAMRGSDTELFENWAAKSRAQKEELLAGYTTQNSFDDHHLEFAQGQIDYSVEADRARYFLEKSRAIRNGVATDDGVGYSVDPKYLEDRPSFLAMSEYVNFISAYAQNIQERYMASLVSMDLQVNLEEWFGIEIDNLKSSTEGMGASGIEAATADFIKQRIVKAASPDDFSTCLELIDYYVETSPTDTYHKYLHDNLVGKRRTINFN